MEGEMEGNRGKIGGKWGKKKKGGLKKMDEST